MLIKGHHPIVFDSLFWGKAAIKAFNDDITIIEGDCRNSRDVIYALENVDSIIHLAGIVGEAACLKNSKAHFSINLESTRTLINCCTDPELDLIRDFLFASSCSVYGNVHNMYDQVNENTPTHPLSDYAWAKLRSENIILERGLELEHFHPTILRISTVFGWSRRPRLDLVTNLFAYLGMKNGNLRIFGDGSQYRSLIHVEDIADAFISILESPRYKRDGEIFNVGDVRNNYTVSQIAETVKKVLPNTQIEYLLDKPTDRRNYSINCTKINNIIGWKAKWNVEEGIKDLIEHLQELDWDWESKMYRNNKINYI